MDHYFRPLEPEMNRQEARNRLWRSVDVFGKEGRLEKEAAIKKQILNKTMQVTVKPKQKRATFRPPGYHLFRKLTGSKLYPRKEDCSPFLASASSPFLGSQFPVTRAFKLISMPNLSSIRAKRIFWTSLTPGQT